MNCFYNGGDFETLLKMKNKFFGHDDDTTKMHENSKIDHQIQKPDILIQFEMVFEIKIFVNCHTKTP
jgi:hypothetical protein